MLNEALRMPGIFKEKKPGQLQVAQGVVLGVISIIVLVALGNILLGQLDTVNTNNLGNNANASAAIDTGFAQLTTSQSVITLVAVMVLLAIAFGAFQFFGGSLRGR